jgi:predicted porin
MKKLILATAIAALTANTASAATVYENNGLTYKLKGDWQVQLRDKYDDTDLDVEFDDLEIKNTVIYDLGNDMKAFGQLDFGFKDAAEGKQNGSDLEESYLGLQIQNVKIKVGKMDLSGDEFGVESYYETPAGIDEDQFDNQATDGDDVIRIDADFDNVFVSASHNLENGGNSITDLFVVADFEAVSVAAAYQTIDNTSDTWGISAEFDAGVATLAADFSATDFEGATADAETTNLVAKFKASDTTKIAVGYANFEQGATDVDGWYANVTYKFPAQKNVSLFAEINDSDAGAETDFLAGMRIKF